ncbi:hypothetical protein DMN77_20805 [Paenibacillus sp. 79R4]|uniref:hypothetical protein n=1 Tax=Paenibacillus sp. 79R4 TaxID=2212847 RepID=UPI0015B7F9EE|nr:hypothetical protein [Paenibacillus sp. 79R4]NWL89994.1 hypothetical protein [Paenibacillus sp. 79R4]
MGHWFYITPEEYAEAAKHGIQPRTLDRRVREQGWNKEQAMTTPPRKQKPRGYYEPWAAVAEKNGVKYGAFMSRIRSGMSPETAATKPLQTIEELRQSALDAAEHTRVYPESYLRMAEENGIPYATFQYRVKYCKWDYERAATEPLWSRQQMGQLGAQRLREREGDWAAQIFGK